MSTLAEFLKSPAGKVHARKEWARIIGVSKSHLSEIASGKVMPSLVLAARIRRHTGVSADSYVDDAIVSAPSSASTDIPASVGQGVLTKPHGCAQ